MYSDAVLTRRRAKFVTKIANEQSATIQRHTRTAGFDSGGSWADIDTIDCMVQEKRGDIEYASEGDRVNQSHVAFVAWGTDARENDRIKVGTEYFSVLAVAEYSNHYELRLLRRT